MHIFSLSPRFKTVCIFGGGDSALDWAIELSNTSKVILVHRRDDFRGMQANIDKVHQLKKEDKIEIYTKYQLDSIQGKEKDVESGETKLSPREPRNSSLFLKIKLFLFPFFFLWELGDWIEFNSDKAVTIYH